MPNGSVGGEGLRVEPETLTFSLKTSMVEREGSAGVAMVING